MEQFAQTAVLAGQLNAARRGEKVRAMESVAASSLTGAALAGLLGLGGVVLGSAIASSSQHAAVEASSRQHELDIQLDAIGRAIAAFHSFRDEIVVRENRRWSGEPLENPGPGSASSISAAYDEMRSAEGILVLLASDKTQRAMWAVDKHLQEWSNEADQAAGNDLIDEANALEPLLGDFYAAARADLESER